MAGSQAPPFVTLQEGAAATADAIIARAQERLGGHKYSRCTS